MWDKLELRLQDIIANNYRKINKFYNGQCTIFVCINCIMSKDKLVGWYKPQLIELEPRGLDPLLIQGLQQVKDWQQVMTDLRKHHNKTLVVRNTKPIGWLP